MKSRRLEITCGEAPFVCSRYDTVTGQKLPVAQRIGFLDRKLRVVSEQTSTRKEWVKWALEALKATYGFEFQGDNLLIARINVLETFCEHLRDSWVSGPNQEELEKACWIISWNFWQMDGLTDAIPTMQLDPMIQSAFFEYAEPMPKDTQPSLFEAFEDTDEDETTNLESTEEIADAIPRCVIYDWHDDEPLEFATLKGEAFPMAKKFYAVIGKRWMGLLIRDSGGCGYALAA